MVRFFAIVVALFLYTLVGHFQLQANAKEKPSNRTLVALGAGMGIAQFFAQAGLHEGSHALTSFAFGNEILSIHPYPHMNDGHFVFADFEGKGELTRGEEITFLIAPATLDLAILGTYTGLLEADMLPENPYALLAVNVAATGAWVDFTKNIFDPRARGDINRIYSLTNIDEDGEKALARGILAATSTAAAIELGRGWFKLFKRKEAKNKRESGQLVAYPNYIGIFGKF